MMPEGLVLQASAPVRSHRRGFSDEVYMEAEAGGGQAVCRKRDL